MTLAAGIAAAVLLAAAARSSAQSLLDVAKNGTPAQVEAAVEAGANIEEIDHFGRTPLMYAAWSNGSLDVIALLLRAGARVEDRNNGGVTPLMYAAGTAVLRIARPSSTRLCAWPFRYELSIVGKFQ